MNPDQSVTYYNVKPSERLYKIFLKRKLHNGYYGVAESVFKANGDVNELYYNRNKILKELKYISIAVKNRKVIGWGLYFTAGTDTGKDSVWVFVAEKYRRKGIGTKLARHVTKTAKNRKVYVDMGGWRNRFWEKALGQLQEC